MDAAANVEAAAAWQKKTCRISAQTTNLDTGVSNTKGGIDEEGVLTVGNQRKRRTVEPGFQRNWRDFRRELRVNTANLGSLVSKRIQSEFELLALWRESACMAHSQPALATTSTTESGSACGQFERVRLSQHRTMTALTPPAAAFQTGHTGEESCRRTAMRMKMAESA